MHDLGVQRTASRDRKKLKDGTGSQTQAGGRLIRKCVLEWSPKLKERVKQAVGTVGLAYPNSFPARVKACFDLIGYDNVAYDVAAVLLGSVSSSAYSARQQLYQFLSRRTRLAWMEKNAPYSLRNLIKTRGHLGGAAWQLAERDAFAGRLTSLETVPEYVNPWGDTLAQVVQSLLLWFVEDTGIAECTVEVQFGKAKQRFGITAKTLAFLEKYTDGIEGLYPFYMPMIVPPVPWDGMWGGGYQTQLLATPPLVGAKEFVQDAIEEDFKTDSRDRPFIRALNALQECAFEINKDVLIVANTSWDAEHNRPAFLPPVNAHAIEDAPPFTGTVEGRSAWRAWKDRRVFLETANVRNRGLRLAFLREKQLANKYESLGSFYFPHTTDFRGRAYPVPVVLTLQGGDFCKGVLRFHVGAPLLTQEAKDWFLIHGANCFGVDKVSFAQRISWAKAHAEVCRAIYADPLDCTFWHDADAPFEFLAWALEYGKWQQEGDRFFSHIPVRMDGTNNGLQLFSLLLRDEEGALATNCINGPIDAPQDIYRLIAARVYAKLVGLASGEGSNKEWARCWLEILDRNCGGAAPRSMVKRAVMTLPYGLTKRGCNNYIEQWHSEELSTDGWFDPVPPCRMLTGVVWAEMQAVLTKPLGAMTWLRKACRVAAKEGKSVRYVTDSGFLVVNEYRQRRVRRLQGSRYRPVNIYEWTNKLDKRSATSGFPPNFIHSLDATILSRVVNRLKNEGVNEITTIHDSYGVLAADAAACAKALREEVCELFKQDPLRQLRDQLAATLDHPERLPKLPEYGSLELERLKESRYLYA